GFDFGLLDQKMDGQITYYDGKTTDAIFSLPLAPSTGFSAQEFNGGTISNKGFEIQANFRAYESRDTRLELGLNWARNRNKLVDLQGATYVGLAGGFGVSTAVKGYPLGTFYGTDFIRCRYDVPDADNTFATSAGGSTN